MAILPDHALEEDVRRPLAALDSKGKLSPAHRRMRNEMGEVGQALQCLYVRPSESTRGAVSAMRAFAKSNGLEFGGKYHDANRSLRFVL